MTIFCLNTGIGSVMDLLCNDCIIPNYKVLQKHKKE